jgi:biopolymer transport protein ExbD
MDLNRLRTLVAAPVASLFLILLLCVLAVQRPVSAGFRVPMIRLHHDPNEPYDCGGRAEFLRMTKDGKTWINSTEIPADQVTARVAALMADRAERVVYVVVDSEVTYGQFAEFVDRISRGTADLHVVRVSGEVRKAFERDHDLCDFQYAP